MQHGKVVGHEPEGLRDGVVHLSQSMNIEDRNTLSNKWHWRVHGTPGHELHGLEDIYMAPRDMNYMAPPKRWPGVYMAPRTCTALHLEHT